MGEERLTDHHRRVLCELIGEPWHQLYFAKDPFRVQCERGAVIKYHLPGSHDNRTFDTWEDYGRCIEAIKEGDSPEFKRLDDFIVWLCSKWGGLDTDREVFKFFLIATPLEINNLIAEWWQERGKG